MPRKAKYASNSAAEDPTSPEALADPRRHVRVEPERVRDVSSVDYPGHWPGEEHSWDLAKFRKGLKVQVTRLSQRSIDFDLVGVDASVANALRRILIAEVPSIAIEDVYVWNNTGVIVDEVLAHRIGLVPLNVDPALIDMKTEPGEQATDRNTLVFKLQVLCTRKPGAPKGQTLPPDELYENHEVKSGDLVWAPAGDQETMFAHVSEKPAPTNLDIVLAKLRPGQQIDMELHAIKGVGKDHAKFSPVATASYRLLPHITLNPEKPVPPELAEKFAKCFTQGVIRVDPKTKKVSVDEKNTRKEQMGREVFRHPEFEDCCKLARVRDYFLFRIESESAYAPERLVTESISVMREKIARLKRETLKLAGVHDEDVQMQS